MKNLATWLLAAAFTTAALPAFAVEPSVQVGYSPEGSARVLVLSAIDSAKTSIRMM
ncbi:TPA: phospholipase D family protein, partial [Escherichia coli]|nr:phospholipase D family protein [Escherichia coli]HAG7266190.1 phospholipase D family protein [Escherichia coli]